MKTYNGHYLFSIDLEDVRDGMSDGDMYIDRVTENTDLYLQFLKKYDAQCTFFTVGKLAEAKPDLIKKIIDQGHEIACHSYAHKPLDELNETEFKTDLEKNIEALHKAGAKDVIGFRAPIFSLIPKTSWAYNVFEEVGIQYSSSILPANNPLYGWADFGTQRKMVGNIIELPQTLLPFSFFQVPFGGGVYFRMLPAPIIKMAFSHFRKKNIAITGYFHPYDVDHHQERFMHPGINNSKVYNFLMYYGRKSVFSKLEKIFDMGFQICTYRDYLKGDLATGRRNRSTSDANYSHA